MLNANDKKVLSELYYLGLTQLVIKYYKHNVQL